MSKNIVEFPKVDDASMVFGGIPDQRKWEKMAQEAGFKHTDGNIFSDYSMKIFFSGGSFPKKKKDVSEEYYKDGITLWRTWLGSWSPKHERKEEVTGYILSLISDEKWIKKELKKK